MRKQRRGNAGGALWLCFIIEAGRLLLGMRHGAAACCKQLMPAKPAQLRSKHNFCRCNCVCCPNDAPLKPLHECNRASPGIAAVDAALQQLGVAPDASGGGTAAALGEQQIELTHVCVVRTLVVLRILLLEARMQLHLLQSNFAAARADVASNMALHGRFKVGVGMAPQGRWNHWCGQAHNAPA